MKPKEQLIHKVTQNENSVWNKEIAALIEKYDIDIYQTGLTEDVAKEQIRKKNLEIMAERIEEERQHKSKIEHWVSRKGDIKIGERPEFLNRLGQKQCSAIIRTRSRILPTKSNMPNNFIDKNCRICKGNIEETQQHILQECSEMGKITEQITNYEDILKDSYNKRMKNIANKITNANEILSDRQQP